MPEVIIAGGAPPDWPRPSLRAGPDSTRRRRYRVRSGLCLSTQWNASCERDLDRTPRLGHRIRSVQTWLAVGRTCDQLVHKTHIARLR